MLVYRNELSHHGIKGQRWGFRRFQNPDGSLTDAGKNRYNGVESSMTDEELTTSVRRMNLEKQYSKLKKENAPPSKMEKSKKLIDATSSLVNQVRNASQRTTKSERKLDLSKMTDKEMRDQINRANLERQYSEMFAPKETVSKGRKYAMSILEIAGPILAIGSSSLGIALAIKELKG